MDFLRRLLFYFRRGEFERDLAEEMRVHLAMTAGMAPSFLGVFVGAGAAMVLSRWMTSLLFGVSPKDPWTFAGTAGLLLVVAALSCFLPARSAARAAPMVSLRTE